MNRFTSFFLASCCVLGYVLVVAALWVCLMTGGEAAHAFMPLGAPVMPFDGIHFLQGVMLAVAGTLLAGWAQDTLSFDPELP